jgi:hypothetical protein
MKPLVAMNEMLRATNEAIWDVNSSRFPYLGGHETLEEERSLKGGA